MSRFDKAIDLALAQASEVENVSELGPEVRTVVLVHAAQGVIDNGGLEYFFGDDFPEQPAYSVFVDAYREIGADGAAGSLERAVGLFPFEEPHLDVSKRVEFMETFRDESGATVAGNPFEPFDQELCGNDDVWRGLEAFVEKHPGAFGLE